MNEMDLALVHRGTRIHATVEYETDRNFDKGVDIIIASVKHEGRDILGEMDQREVEQLESHIEQLRLNKAADEAEGRWLSNREEV